MGKLIHLIDRTRVETREECPRKRFIGFDRDGAGYDTAASSLPTLSGIAIHNAHARLLVGEHIEPVITSTMTDYTSEIGAKGLLQTPGVTPEFIREQGMLLEGMVRAWALLRLPQLLEDYEIEEIEQRWDWELFPGLVMRRRFDVLLRRRGSGELFILDFKTVKFPSDVWADKFETSKQTMLYLQSVIEQRPNEVIGGILYEGLVKGERRKDTNRSSPFYEQHVHHSPYTVAYAVPGDCGVEYQTGFTSRKGTRKVRPYDEMPMKEWVEHYLLKDDAIKSELFVQLPEILPASWQLLREKEQTVSEELRYHSDLATYHQMVTEGHPRAEQFLNSFAPLRASACFKYGRDYRCKFYPICWNGVEPLDEESGYTVRVPHHDTDLKMVS